MRWHITVARRLVEYGLSPPMWGKNPRWLPLPAGGRKG